MTRSSHECQVTILVVPSHHIYTDSVSRREFLEGVMAGIVLLLLCLSMLLIFLLPDDQRISHDD